MATVEQVAEFNLALVQVSDVRKLIANKQAAVNLDDQPFEIINYTLAPQATQAIAAGANFLAVIAPTVGLQLTVNDTQGTPGSITVTLNRFFIMLAPFSSATLKNNNAAGGQSIGVQVFRA